MLYESLSAIAPRVGKTHARVHRMAGAGVPVVCAVCGHILLGGAMESQGQTFYVDATNGDDASDGLSPDSPWRSLGRANTATIGPGGRALFKRGEIWRGQLLPKSGKQEAPVTYGAYGEGPKPVLLGSTSRNAPDDWHHQGDNVWATAKASFVETGVATDLAAKTWSVHRENGARVKVTREGAAVEGGVVYRFQCEQNGTRSNHIQLYISGLSVADGRYYQFTFRAQCSKPFEIPAIRLQKRSKPWSSYGGSTGTAFAIGSELREYHVRFRASVTADDARIVFFLGGALPPGSTFTFEPLSLSHLRCDQAEPISVDVGNIIFDHGASTGVKKWSRDALEAPGDYWYCADTWQVFLYSVGNPGRLHQSVELALRRHIISQGGVSHVTYEDLALHYGAAHGIGGGTTHHIIVRDCDLSYIGGGHQFTRPGGRPVRYGNAIEFWGDAHDNLVEGCRIWEVYDAALTNQGGSGCAEYNITYRNNVIWNSEYSFEYWNRKGSTTRNILFENNTCVDAGHGWAHGQRPDRNGRHLMFYWNPAETSGFVVRNNIFYNATESCLRMANDWTASFTMERNCWFQPKGALVTFLKESFRPDQFADYQKRTGLDASSIVADPEFVAPGKLDFRLSADSPARTLGPTGGPVGSEKRLQE